MNERIKELWERACTRYSVYETLKPQDERKIIPDIFAELIVKECLEEMRYTVLDTQELRRDRSTDYQVGWEDGMFGAGEMIKQHFGVEE